MGFFIVQWVSMLGLAFEPEGSQYRKERELPPEPDIENEKIF